jgi:hypothetical protein
MKYQKTAQTPHRPREAPVPAGGNRSSRSHPATFTGMLRPRLGFVAARLMSIAAAALGLYLGAFIASDGNPVAELERATRILAEANCDCPIPFDIADPRFGTNPMFAQSDH